MRTKNANFYSIPVALIIFCIISCNRTDEPGTAADLSTKPILGSNGLRGYIGYGVSSNPQQYGAGVSFYTAAWKLVDQPILNFQIGLPGTWIIPDNSENNTISLCPPGTLASNWSERGPTFRDVFQTLEGGLGYWAGNKYRYGPPKYSMNATSQCYDFEIASPGWSFFYDDNALPDERLGIAQLHNRLLIPPDGITFSGDPNGQFMGYSYMALPFTDPYEDEVITGEQSWTCFINTNNFKGPIAYYLPETWSKLSRSYPIINGRGLDSRPGIANGGAMEINTVPYYEARDSSGTLYTKIPNLSFPVNEDGIALLVQDLSFYSKDALYNDLLAWRNNESTPMGLFNQSGTFKPILNTYNPSIKQRDKPISNLEQIFTPFVESSTFGLKWNDSEFINGSFPQYFKESGDVMIPVKEEDVPPITGLKNVAFPTEENRPAYSARVRGSWASPGPSSGPYTTMLNDGSTVTYYWYRFIDQPVFQQYDWSDEKKNALQALVEKIHAHWTSDKDYIPPPSMGDLVSLDNNLIVNPPEGLEVGYVPIVTNQDR